ncbi:MAG: hypothetical protein OEU92_12000 [Alphaproteobacteria bacterium]|nr:hypothetical protein [Alphaproteobacteria bacterium]
MKSISPLLALMLAACISTTEAGTRGLSAEQVYAGTSKAEVWQAVMKSLEANDLPVVAADFERGKIRARQHNYLDVRFAACPNLDNRSFDPLSPANFGVRSAPLYRGVDLRLEISETETGTRLSLDPRYYNVGRDLGRREFAIQIHCRSTGVLEQALFTAAGAH